MDRGNLVAEICRIQDLPEDIRNKLESSPGTVFPYEDRLITLISGKVYSFPDDEDGRTVAGAVEARQAAVSQQPASAADIYHRILTDSHYQPLPSVIRQYGIRPERKRCVAVFRACSPLDTDLRTAILSMAPVEKEDAVIPLDDQTAAYIKDLEGQTTDDMAEFTEAVIGTLETEGILDIRAGIGGESHKLDDLRDSFSEGRKALFLGMRYHMQDRIYVYARQMLERIIDTIPADRKKEIRSAFYGNSPETAMSDEMLETVRVFFRNDLNLTAASKQLFIHRNTLNYRLDKIKKEFGLDLRSFSDAVVFRIISEMTDES